MNLDWRTLQGAELEQHFNPRAAVTDFQAWLDDYRRLSDAAAARFPDSRTDLRYGPGPLQTLDVHRARDGELPTLIFFHGGYWRGLDKRDTTFALEPVVAAGALAINVNYDLCPAVTLDRVVEQARAAVAWVWQHAGELGADRERMFVAGHSAGAHLAAMCLGHDWGRNGLPANPVQGITAISGVYELEPVLHTTVNAEIRLDLGMARRNSPTLHPPGTRVPVLIAVGDAETEGWIAQSIDFHAACRAAGTAADLWRLAGEHHFSILTRLADARHPLTTALRRQMGL